MILNVFLLKPALGILDGSLKVVLGLWTVESCWREEESDGVSESEGWRAALCSGEETDGGRERRRESRRHEEVSVNGYSRWLFQEKNLKEELLKRQAGEWVFVQQQRTWILHRLSQGMRTMVIYTVCTVAIKTWCNEGLGIDFSSTEKLYLLAGTT